MQILKYALAAFVVTIVPAQPVCAQDAGHDGAQAEVDASAAVLAGVEAWSRGEYAAAVALWRPLANAGDADAMFNLAQAYRLGRGVEEDVAQARSLYAAAAERGHVHAADNYGLLLFQQGEQAAAMPMIRDAAERGDPRAQYVLGVSHFNGDFAELDWVRAYALLTLASSAEFPAAQNALAQVDDYVPLEQKEQAQTLARQLEQEAQMRRSVDLASLELGVSSGEEVASPAAAAAPSALPPVPSPPARVASTAASPAEAPAPAVTQARAPARMGAWGLQLGAFSTARNADNLWSRLETHRALAGARKSIERSGNISRLVARGFDSRSEALAACNLLKRDGQDCLLRQP